MEALEFIKSAGDALAPWAPWSLVLVVALASAFLTRYIGAQTTAVKTLAEKQTAMGTSIEARIDKVEASLWGEIGTLRTHLINYLANEARRHSGEVTGSGQQRI